MSRRGIVKTAKEYSYIVSILKNKSIDSFDGNKYQKSRLKAKAKKFLMINDQLFSFCEDGNHKKVISFDNKEYMIQEVQKLHNSTHFGQNKMQYMCNKYILEYLGH